MFRHLFTSALFFVPITASAARGAPASIVAETLAAEDPGVEALHQAGDIAALGRQFAEARQLFQRAADQGHAPSMRRLGNLHGSGMGGARDQAKARELYLAAAKLGDVNAMGEFARMASYGWGGPQDTASAVEWAARAFADGHTSAVQVLGSIYEEGRGVPRDLAKALEWYDRGRERDDRYSGDAAFRLRQAAQRTPAQKLATFEAALGRIGNGPTAARDRGRAFWLYFRALHDAGSTGEEAAEIARPGFKKLVETDFHAVPAAISSMPPHLRPAIQALLSDDQRRVVEQIYQHTGNRSRPAPEIRSGQGWSSVYPEGKRPAVALAATAPAAATAAAPKAEPAPALRVPPLSEATRAASDWDGFFAAVGRARDFHAGDDGAAFYAKSPAPTGRIRAAYRRAAAALRPTVGADLGRGTACNFAPTTRPSAPAGSMRASPPSLCSRISRPSRGAACRRFITACRSTAWPFSARR